MNHQNIESSYLMCLDGSNLYGWAISQKFSVSGFKWEKKYLNSMKTSDKTMMKTVTKDIFLK